MPADPLDTIDVPTELLEYATDGIINPLAFGGLLPQILGENGAEHLVKVVINAIGIYLTSSAGQVDIEDRLIAQLDDGQLPEDPYERHNMTSEMTAAFLRTIGVPG